MKRIIGAIVAVFVLWGVLDFLLHGVLMTQMYAATAPLWRPRAEMQLWLIYLVTLISAGCFVGIYGLLTGDGSLTGALRYGLLFGVAAGMSMGFGMYAVMPIPLGMAVIWCLGILVESLAGAWVAWAVLRRGSAGRG